MGQCYSAHDARPQRPEEAALDAAKPAVHLSATLASLAPQTLPNTGCIRREPEHCGPATQRLLAITNGQHNASGLAVISAGRLQQLLGHSSGICLLRANALELSKSNAGGGSGTRHVTSSPLDTAQTAMTTMVHQSVEKMLDAVLGVHESSASTDSTDSTLRSSAVFAINESLGVLFRMLEAKVRPHALSTLYHHACMPCSLAM